MVTVELPAIVTLGATLLTVIDLLAATCVPSSSTSRTTMLRVASPSAYVCDLAPPLVYVLFEPSPQSISHCVTVSLPALVIAPSVSAYAAPSLVVVLPLSAIVGATTATLTALLPAEYVPSSSVAVALIV